jgi:hypothetical protein
MRRIEISVGQRFGLLTVIQEVDQGKRNARRFLMRCDCGNQKIIPMVNMRIGDTTSCGCVHKKQMSQRNYRHGKRHTSIYHRWLCIKDRCTNPNNKSYKRYGGRGIGICKEWSDSFQAFYDYLGDPPFPKADIDRIDNHGKYEPGNVRWVTRMVNSNNTRQNVRYAWQGQQRTLRELSDMSGIKYQALNDRLKRGWTMQEAMNIPAGGIVKSYREGVMTWHC